MIGQLVGLFGIAVLLWFLSRERERYQRIQRIYDRECARQERAVQRDLREFARTGDVDAAPVNAPVYPIEFARSRRKQAATRNGDAA